MTVITRHPGIWLADHKPVRSQFRTGRRATPKPVIVVHTTESGPGSDAFAVARFIQRRTDPGSYHPVGDRKGNIVQLVDFKNEAFGDGTGSNPWACHISLAMDAAEWGTLATTEWGALVDVCAEMAADVARWHLANGRPIPAAQLLSKSGSERADASGFISHARRDPNRRTDPGDKFPWAAMLARYQAIIGGPTPMPTQPDRTAQVLRWQRALIGAGYADTDAVTDYADGDFGPQTLTDSLALLADLDDSADPDTLRKADLLDQVLATVRVLTTHAGKETP